MISGCGKALAAQPLAHGLHIFSGGAVDDAAPALLVVFFHQPFQVGIFVGGTAHLKIKIFSVKARDQSERVIKLQQAGDIVTHSFRGCGGERSHNRSLWKCCGKPWDIQIRGTEVLTPLGNAVRLVNGYHRYLGVHGIVHEHLAVKAFGGDVDKLVSPTLRISQHRVKLIHGKAAVDESRWNTRLHQRAYLILHQ